MYVDVNSVVKDITEEDYEKDAKTRAINLTEAGIAKIEKKLMDKGLIDSPLYDSSNVSMVYYVNCALKANKLFKRGKAFIIFLSFSWGFPNSFKTGRKRSPVS